MDCLREVEGKCAHDPWFAGYGSAVAATWVPGAVIVGAGPSGLAVAACLKEKSVPTLIIERSCCIASLWQLKTYDRLCLHLPKQFCELPLMAFPDHFPTYPSKQQFISYLEEYAKRFNLCPAFNEAVERAEYDHKQEVWRVRTRWVKKEVVERREYLCKWLVAATGENAEAVVPDIEGMGKFGGDIVHTSSYRSGEGLHGKRVLVVGCGNSGMEVSLDLCNHNALPSLVVRDSVHILPREMLGTSTIELSWSLLNWLPIKFVDQFLLLMSRLMLGDTASLGLRRPRLGPLQLKGITGRTPVLDAGTLARIRAGDIKVFPGIQRLATDNMVEFVDGRKEKFDALILATGYKSNLPSWLMEREFFSKKDGFPRRPFPDGWKGKNGLYAVGFTKRGLLGTSMDAKRIAQDIGSSWSKGSQPLSSLRRSSLVQNKGCHELEERAKIVSRFIQWKDGGDSKDLCPRNPIASHNLQTISIHIYGYDDIDKSKTLTNLSISELP